MLIERLALKVHARAGSSTRSCAWRAAACGRATCSRASSTSRWRSWRPAPTAPRPARSRAGSTSAKYITLPQGELAGPRAAGRRPRRIRGVTLRARRRPAARHAVDQRAALRGDLEQGRVEPTRPTTTSSTAADHPWIHQPFEEYDDHGSRKARCATSQRHIELRHLRSESGSSCEKHARCFASLAAPIQMAVHSPGPSVLGAQERDSNLHGVTR